MARNCLPSGTPKEKANAPHLLNKQQKTPFGMVGAEASLGFLCTLCQMKTRNEEHAKIPQNKLLEVCG